MKIVLVDIGVFQSYILDNIRNLQLFGNTDITVITEPQFYGHFDGLHVTLVDSTQFPDNFTHRSNMDRNFRGGFWLHCSRRLFLLEQWMRSTNAPRIVHIENDVMVYCNLDQIFGDETDDKLWLAIDAPHRCIPSIMFIPTHSHIENVIKDYVCTQNDMDNLSNFFNRRRDQCEALPIAPSNNGLYSSNFSRFGSIFDAASIGQYLGGVDPRNTGGDTRGFINETCVVQYNRYSFCWKTINGLYVPHIIDGTNVVPINNLHVHSKRLCDFMGNRPNETHLIPIV